jgi:hypothetical protein
MVGTLLTTAGLAAIAPAASASIQGIGALASGQFKYRKQLKDQLRRSVDRMRSGNLGMAKSDRMQAMGEIKADINAANATQNEELRRGVASSGLGGVSRSLPIVAAQAQAKSNALAGARTQLQAQSEEIARQQYAEGQAALQGLAGMGSPVAQAIGNIVGTAASAGVSEYMKNPEGSLSGQQQRVKYTDSFKSYTDQGLPKDVAKRLAYNDARTVPAGG